MVTPLKQCSKRIAETSTPPILLAYQSSSACIYLLSDQVRDSNTPALCHLVTEDGYHVTHITHLPDSLEHVVAGLREALSAADIILTTGGSTVSELFLA